jgi:hypothetical protein
MDMKWIGVLVTIFIGMTLICNVMQGTDFITADDRDILDNQGMTQEIDIGFFSIPVPGLNYVTGIIRMLDFKEYNDIIFTGNAQIIYFIMAGISFIVGFFIFISVLQLGVNAIRGR